MENSQENTCARVSFAIKLQTRGCNFIQKETPALVFSYEFVKFSRTSILHNIRSRSFTTHPKFSQKLTFLTARIRGSQMLAFQKILHSY